MKSRKQKEVEFCDDYDKAAKYIDNSVKNLRSFCQKANSTTELQNEFGDYLKELGLENEDELGETLIKLGDCLKSMATLNHVMLCNIEDNYLQPITDYRKDLVSNNELSSAEQYANKCLKQEEHMKQLLQFFMCFYHYYSEGYTLTFHLKEPLEKIKDRSVKNVIAMRDQVMEELKPKKKPLPSPPSASSSTSPNSFSSSSSSLKRQDSTLSGAQFKKAPPIPKHASSLSFNSTMSDTKPNNGYHQNSDSYVSTISNRSSSSSSSEEYVEQVVTPRNAPVVTPRGVIPPKPTAKPPMKTQSPPSTDNSPVVEPKVIETTTSNSNNTWKKPVAPTIKRNDNITQPIQQHVEPIVQLPSMDVSSNDSSNNNSNSNGSWKKPIAPSVKKQETQSPTFETQRKESTQQANDSSSTKPQHKLATNSNEESSSLNGGVSSFKKNLEQSIQFRLPGLANNNSAQPETSPSSETGTARVVSRPSSKPPVPQSRRPVQPSVPPHVAKCKAVYPYTAQSSEELTFKPGDVILIFEKEQDFGWWKGSVESDLEKKGMFPSNYVQII